ncbi:MAG: hypothetical protein IJF07_09660 [Lachnospiraceae bacterium]|nr:hypothetical protein [Lachnospiraceae bacterium]
MRKYDKEQGGILTRVVCNHCGQDLLVEQGYLKEGCFNADFSFGYFSKKDGMRHKFDLCECCYNEMIKRFVVPVEETENTELV